MFIEKYVLEIHNDEEYEDYSHNALCIFDTYDEAHKFISKYEYINDDVIENIEYRHGRKNKYHNKNLLDIFFDKEEYEYLMYSCGYLTISKILYYYKGE